MISKSSDLGQNSQIGKAVATPLYMGTGGGGTGVANMEIFTKNFQHFWSKTLSGNAFFNVIGSTMDANVIITNEHPL